MDDHQNPIIIFCQAPADVQYILSLYGKIDDKSEIDIYVIGLAGIFDFLLTLKLKANIHFIPFIERFSTLNPLQIRKNRNCIIKTYSNYFKKTTQTDVYFFSKYFDWLTHSFIYRLSQRNRIIYCSHSDNLINEQIERRNNIRVRFREFIYFITTTVKLKIYYLQTREVVSFPLELIKYESLEIPIDPSIFNLYEYKDPDALKNSVLFFEYNQKGYEFIADYQEKITEIISFIKQRGFKVVVKPHPRIQHSLFLNSITDKILPYSIPGEFINLDPYKIIIGIDTAATAYVSSKTNKPLISLIDLLTFKNEDTRSRFKSLLYQLSNGKIIFIKSLSELSDFLT